MVKRQKSKRAIKPKQSRSIISDDIFIPNHSGDHSAGKTGTAQIGGSEDTHAWFTSFGPFGEPELVLTIVLERGGAGDKAAVPFAEQIWKWWIENRQN